MALLSKTDFASSWLKRFGFEDRKIIIRLIDEIPLITRDELNRGLIGLLDALMASRLEPARPLALFAEREIARTGKNPNAYFPGSSIGRAIGRGVSPIAPNDQEVGSEGTIANLITNYARLNRGLVLSHPGPDLMRSSKVGPIALVTDFIGSGRRVSDMLEAFASVATLQSWHSYGYIDFHVIAYSGTDAGISTVRSSRLRPQVHQVIGCPTVRSVFRGAELEQMLNLCNRYPGSLKWPLGYQNNGALIAFAHGMPNNAPLLLHTTKQGWQPLFRNRSTLGADLEFPSDAAAQALERASTMLKVQSARDHLKNPSGERWITTMLVLAAISDGASSTQRVSALSRVTIARVEEVISTLLIARWVSRRGALVTLSDLGRRELQRLRRRRSRAPILPTPAVPFYFPTQLRGR